MNRKLLSVITVLALVMGVITSCSAHKGDKKEFSDSPWYEMKSFATTDYGKSNGYAVPSCSNVIYCDDDSIVFLENYTVGQQDEIVEGTPYAESDDVFNISKYSLAEENYGELIGYYDLMSGDIMDHTYDSIVSNRLIGAFQNGDDVDVLMRSSDPSSFNDGEYKLYKINLENSSLISEREVDLSQIGNYNMSPIANIIGTDSGYKMATISWSDATVKIHEFDSDFNYVDTLTVSGLEQYTISYIEEVALIDDDYCYLNVEDDNYEQFGILYNVVTGESSKQPELYMSGMNSIMSAEAVYLSDMYSLKKLNMLTGEETTVMEYNNCIMDYNQVQGGLYVSYADSSHIISYNFLNHGYSIVEFKPLNSNPYEGKTPIKVAFLDGYVPEVICTAIYEYNLQSTDSYIYVDPRYMMERASDYESDNYKEQVRATASEIGDQLMVDIIAGDGPDIIINGYNYNQFNNPNVLVDLNPLIDADNSFNREDYFSAIFASDTAELYQIPYEVGLLTLIGSEDAATYCSDSYGMTLEDFNEVVNTLNNGLNPLQANSSKAECFVTMFNWNREHFFSDGKVSIDRDYFIELAEYVNNLNEIDSDTFFASTWDNPLDVKQDSYYGATAMSRGEVVLGLPSPDGMMPLLHCCSSIGITTSCSNPEAAWDFVKTVFGAECQSRLWAPANRTIREAKENEQIQERIKSIEIESYLFSFMSEERYRDDVVELYIAGLDAATAVYSSDSDIDIILYEEIQPYLAGDKTIDETIDLITNRIQLVLDERG